MITLFIKVCYDIIKGIVMVIIKIYKIIMKVINIVASIIQGVFGGVNLGNAKGISCRINLIIFSLVRLKMLRGL